MTTPPDIEETYLGETPKTDEQLLEAYKAASYSSCLDYLIPMYLAPYFQSAPEAKACHEQTVEDRAYIKQRLKTALEGQPAEIILALHFHHKAEMQERERQHNQRYADLENRLAALEKPRLP